MRITSLTGFSSKLARVYVMKVSFLLENRNGRGVQARRGLTGAAGAALPQDRRAPPGAAAVGTGSVHPKRGQLRGPRLRVGPGPARSPEQRCPPCS